ncbi:hypothetical protein Cri9333_0331 [Crinalium epipsammum PCC 9333]|uniref:Uncharacterized protein n=1 Tax=Crinalium epipsammum PCC 9333 TaxID=1173022 RepID=K9VTB2_9CYAN|nr:hypothetical protein [Crinalium epipsammum]AFZ11313.1 hypothetical protein Cri9333_0331 [Crinalium epipsammum PCC 9333]
MKSEKKIQFGAIALVSLLSPLTFLSEAHAERVIGGVNLAEYCTRKYGAPVVLNPPYNAFTWVCRVQSSSLGASAGGSFTGPEGSVSGQISTSDFGISVQEVCELEYPQDQPWKRRAIARVTNPSSPYSWVCVVP